MNFVQHECDTATYDKTFWKRLKEMCEKCIIHFPEKNELKGFLQQSKQIIFLEQDETLENPEREILRLFFMNNQFLFLIFYQLWIKFGVEFFFSWAKDTKVCLCLQIKQGAKIIADDRKTQRSAYKSYCIFKIFFLDMAQIFNSYFMQSEFTNLYRE